MNLGSLTVTMMVDTSALEMASAKVSSFIKKTNAMNQRIRTVGYLASAVVTAPMVAAGRAAFNMAKEYEFSMQRIVGLTGTSQEVVDRWSESVKSMALEFGKSPKEIAEALYFIASSGIATADALDVLRMSVKAAASGLGETSDIANYLTSVLNAYRGTGVTAAYATDVLVAAVREGKAEASGFATAMGQVIPIASKMGVEIDQVAGAIAAITLTGSSAAQAATYLKNIFNALFKEAEKGQKAMTSASLALDGMNTSYADLRKVLRDQGVVALVEKIRTLTAQYGETLVAQVFPEIRAMTGMMSLMGKNFEYNNSIMKEITESSGSLSKAFSSVSNTIKVRYDRALQSVNVSLIKLGQSVAVTIIPLLEKFAVWLNKVTEHFNSLTEEQKRFRLIVAAVVAAAGPLALLLSTLGYVGTGLIGVVTKLGRGFVLLARGMGLSAIAAATAEASMAATATAAVAAEGAVAATATATAAAGVSAGVAATSFLAFGAAMAVFGLGVWLVVENAIKPLIQKIVAMRKEYRDTMDLVNGTDVQMDLDASIIAKHWDLDKLSQGGLENLKSDIQQRIALEKEDLDNANLVNEEKLKAEKGYQDKLEEIKRAHRNWEWTRETSYGGIDLKNAFYAYQETFQKLEKERDDYIKNGMAMAEFDRINSQSIIDHYTKIGAKVDAALSQITNPIKQAEDELENLRQQTEEVDAAFFDLMIGERAIARMTSLLGGSYDDITERTQLYKGILERLIKIEVEAGHSIPWVTAKIRELAKSLAELAQVKFDRELQNIQGLGAILGRSFTGNAEAANLLKQALVDFNANTRGTAGVFKAMGIQGAVLQTILDGLTKRWKSYVLAAAAEDTEKTVGLLMAQKKAFQTIDSEIELVSAEIEGYKKQMETLYELNEQGSDSWGRLADNIEDAQLALQALQAERNIAPLQAMVSTFGRYEDVIALASAQMDVAKDKMDLLVAQGKAFSDEYYAAADSWVYFKSMLELTQDASQIDFAKTMFAAFKDSTHLVELLNVKVEVLTNHLHDLAAMKLPGWEADFKKTAEEMDKLSIQIGTFSTLESAFTDLFTISKDKFEDFGSWMLDWLTSLGESLSRVLAEFVSKKLVGAIAKAFGSEEQDMAELLTSVALGKAKSYEALAIAVAEAAKVGYPALLVSIPSAAAAVIGALGAGAASVAAISGAATAPTGFAEGGVVPAGYPHDTFPAMLTSGEIILPQGKAAEFADQIVNKKRKEEEAALMLPRMQNGGIVPAGYPNDTFAAMLSSGEAVMPLDKIEDILKRYPAVFKIIDERSIDSITGEPVSDYSKLHGTLDLSFVEEVVRKALERGIDPYTALAIPHQETGGTPSSSANPYAVNYTGQDQFEKLVADPIGASLDILKDKLKLADRLGYDTYAKMVQTYNGIGRLTQGAVGPKAYGVSIPEEGVSMKENPLYGKRIEDIRDNILMQNEQLVSFIDTLMSKYEAPTLPSALFKKEEPTPIEYASAIPTDMASATDAATEALRNYINALEVVKDVTATNTSATEAETVAKDKNIATTAAAGVSNVVSTAIQGGNVGQAAVAGVGATMTTAVTDWLTPMLSAIPIIGPFLGPLLGGLLGGLFTGAASKMATGGIIPHGYPNDTYPALLSSGETVLPREYKDMPDMIGQLTKQGSIPSGSISDELQLLLSTYQLDFPEEKFKSLLAPLMKHPVVAAEKSLQGRKKMTSRIYNVNNYTNNLTKITKDQALKSASITKQLSKVTSKGLDLSKLTKGIRVNKTVDKGFDFNKLTKSLRTDKTAGKGFDFTKITKGVRGSDKLVESLARATVSMKGMLPKQKALRTTGAESLSSQAIEKLFKMKRTNEKSLEYLTRISRGTEVTEKLLSGADYYPNVARMAGGGTVPPGYPNDSFPAFLSSGEFVLPKNVRNSIKNIEQKAQHITVKVEGKVAGKDLMLIARRAAQYS